MGHRAPIEGWFPLWSFKNLYCERVDQNDRLRFHDPARA